MRQRKERAGLVVGVMVLSLISGCLCPPKGTHKVGEIPVPPQEPIATTPEPPPPPLPPPPTPTPEPPKPTPTPAQKLPPTIIGKPTPTGITFDSDVLFDSGSTVVKPRAKEALLAFAKDLNKEEYKNIRMNVVGFTDTDRVVKASTIDNLKKLGKSADNQGLSEARAEAVAAVLEEGGVAASRLTTKGKGASDPVADNKTPEGKARNRRVEVSIIK